jgi:hypothetical protein
VECFFFIATIVVVGGACARHIEITIVDQFVVVLQRIK